MRKVRTNSGSQRRFAPAAGLVSDLRAAQESTIGVVHSDRPGCQSQQKAGRETVKKEKPRECYRSSLVYSPPPNSPLDLPPSIHAGGPHYTATLSLIASFGA